MTNGRVNLYQVNTNVIYIVTYIRDKRYMVYNIYWSFLCSVQLPTYLKLHGTDNTESYFKPVNIFKVVPSFSTCMNFKMYSCLSFDRSFTSWCANWTTLEFFPARSTIFNATFSRQSKWIINFLKKPCPSIWKDTGDNVPNPKKAVCSKWPVFVWPKPSSELTFTLIRYSSWLTVG